MINLTTALTGPPVGAPTGPAEESEAPIEGFAAALGQLLVALGLPAPVGGLDGAPAEPGLPGGLQARPDPSLGEAATQTAALPNPVPTEPPSAAAGLPDLKRPDPSLGEAATQTAALPNPAPTAPPSAAAGLPDLKRPDPSLGEAATQTGQLDPSIVAAATEVAAAAGSYPALHSDAPPSSRPQPGALSPPAPPPTMSQAPPVDDAQVAPAEPEATLAVQTAARPQDAADRPSRGVATAPIAAAPDSERSSAAVTDDQAPPDGRAGDRGRGVLLGERSAPHAAPAIEVVNGAPAGPPTSPSQLASTPTPPAETNPASEPARVIAERAVSHVTERLDLMAREGVQEARVRLNPPELGEVRIRLTVEGGNLDVSLASDRPATREMLMTALPDLRQALEARSLSPQRLDVDSQGAGSPWSDRGAESEQGDNRRQPSPSASYADPGARRTASDQARTGSASTLW